MNNYYILEIKHEVFIINDEGYNNLLGILYDKELKFFVVTLEDHLFIFNKNLLKEIAIFHLEPNSTLPKKGPISTVTKF
jgi:hypothetical protein